MFSLIRKFFQAGDRWRHLLPQRTRPTQLVEVTMTRIDKQRQQRLRMMLSEEKRKLWNKVRVELFETLGEGLHTQYDIPQDAGEQGILDLLEDTGLKVADIRMAQLTRMEEALRRLEMGTYGRCEDCGEVIDEARLQVAPYAPCCIRCQQRREGPAGPTGLTL
jgi:DnaK suppressor protein